MHSQEHYYAPLGLDQGANNAQRFSVDREPAGWAGRNSESPPSCRASSARLVAEVSASSRVPLDRLSRQWLANDKHQHNEEYEKS
jgi:hypothetical protein